MKYLYIYIYIICNLLYFIYIMSQSEISELLSELDSILAAQDGPAHEFIVCGIYFC